MLLPGRARRRQLQMKPVARSGQRTQYRAGVAVAITGQGTGDTLQFRCCFAQDFSTWLLSRACKSLDRPQGTTGKRRKGRAASDVPDAECRHADMELRVCWGPGCSFGLDGRQFLAREPRAGVSGDDKKCPGPSKHRLTNRLGAWLFVTILSFIRQVYVPRHRKKFQTGTSFSACVLLLLL